MVADFKRMLDEFQSLVDRGKIEEAFTYLDENPDVSRFIENQEEAALQSKGNSLESIALDVQRRISLSQKGVSDEVPHYMGRTLKECKMEIDTAATYYCEAQRKGVSPIASATMVSIIGLVEWGEEELQHAIKRYGQLKNQSHENKTFKHSMDDSFFRLFCRYNDHKNHNEIYLGIKSLEDVK